ncbi:37S ribosomal protein S8, mitochondrial [Neolecta irregularis DAH-3]|uniref:37S ribosomal protein S8, mitochondrial n=1 Tax=Neolecta irregularis (strain DAH-3) TaxID=1198029 RepID=A0A1U7LR35_NEOID|nr:37S ribosomal protein S8, mitochondrial [Neolecta irregularis DAH-3]|eukprot:OLL25012.1 37S ribosomal protein S8, mitochondrial [Neolecta irregularis DAH-3]
MGLMSVPNSKVNLGIAFVLYQQGLISSVQRGSITGPDQEYTPTTQENVATRRIWLGLKYREMHPVIGKMGIVSKPGRRMWMSAEELKRLVIGKRVGTIHYLQPGEILVVSTDKGILEARDAIRLRVGGEPLCRAG